MKKNDTNYLLMQLGDRICILGCSASGKSTLAKKLADKLQLPLVHLDLLAHYSNSNWQRKPNSELITQHRQVIESKQWIIEGNYSICMLERLEKATAVIWLDANIIKAAYRYIKRSICKNDRIGKLPGSKKEFSFALLKHIIFMYPKNRNKYDNLLKKINIPIIRIYSLKELQRLYIKWDLLRV